MVFETGQSLQAVQRELENLVDLGIIRRTEAGSCVYYRIDPNSCFLGSLKEIFTHSR